MFSFVFAYDIVPLQNGGDLTGTISFKGEAPVKKPIKVDRNADYCGDTIPDESLLINPENKGIENAAISFENISSEFSLPVCSSNSRSDDWGFL